MNEEVGRVFRGGAHKSRMRRFSDVMTKSGPMAIGSKDSASYTGSMREMQLKYRRKLDAK